MALGLTFAVEVIVLKGDIGRMNTVFKFYLQVWIILGIASAVMIGWLAQRMNRWAYEWSTIWTAAMVGLVIAGLLYPIFATRAKINDRFDRSLGPTLDAMEFMTVARPTSKVRTIPSVTSTRLIWMQDHIQGTPVVAESAAANEYRSLRNRVPTYTGLPSDPGLQLASKAAAVNFGIRDRGSPLERRESTVHHNRPESSAVLYSKVRCELCDRGLS